MSKLTVTAFAVLSVTLMARAAPARAQARTAAASLQPMQPGDRILVWVPADSLRRDTLVVEETGFVALPRVGRVNAAGIPAGALADTIRARYRRLLRTDDVLVIPLHRVSVLGEVRKPGIYFLGLTASLRDAVALAEGVTDIGNPCCITVVRDSSREKIRDWQTRPASELDIASGDAIVVDRESWFKRNVLSVLSGSAILVTAIIALRR
jgi:polysaccharide export outer membrane protein